MHLKLFITAFLLCLYTPCAAQTKTLPKVPEARRFINKAIRLLSEKFKIADLKLLND
jgi:hypothetical protein